MKEEPPYNPYTFDPYEPHPRDLESAIGRFLGFLFGLGIAITICGIISIRLRACIRIDMQLSRRHINASLLSRLILIECECRKNQNVSCYKYYRAGQSQYQLSALM